MFSISQTTMPVNLEPWAGLNKTTFSELVEHLIRTDVKTTPSVNGLATPPLRRSTCRSSMSQGWHPVSRETVMSLIEGLMSSYPSDNEKTYRTTQRCVLLVTPPSSPECAPLKLSPVSPEERRVRKRKMANVTRPSMEPQCRRKSESNAPLLLSLPLAMPLPMPIPVPITPPLTLPLSLPISVPLTLPREPRAMTPVSTSPLAIYPTPAMLRPAHCVPPARRSSAPVACVGTSAAWVAISKREVHSLIDDVYPSRLEATPETPERHSVGSVQRNDLLKPRKWKSRLMQRLLTQHSQCS